MNTASVRLLSKNFNGLSPDFDDAVELTGEDHKKARLILAELDGWLEQISTWNEEERQIEAYSAAKHFSIWLHKIIHGKSSDYVGNSCSCADALDRLHRDLLEKKGSPPPSVLEAPPQ